MKRGKKALAVLSTAALLGTTPAAVALPLLTATVAHAAGSATAMTTPNVSSTVSTPQNLGTINISWPKGSLDSSDDQQVTFMLPSGFQFPNTGTWYSFTTGNTTTYYDTTGTPPVTSPDVAAWVRSGTASDTALLRWDIVSPTLLKLTVVKDYTASGVPNTVQTAIGNPSTPSNQTDDWNIYVQLHNITVNGPAGGPVNVTMVGPSDTALPLGTVTVANVATAGKVDLAAADVKSNSNEFTFNLSVAEEVAGSLRPNTDAIKLKLPAGFKWDTNSTWDPSLGATGTSSIGTGVLPVFGDGVTTPGTVSLGTPNASTNHNIGVHVTNDGDQTLTIKIDGLTVPDPTDQTHQRTLTNQPTDTATGFLIQNLKFYVDDENVARTGDVTVQVTGGSPTNVSNLVVGHYGQIGFTATAESQPTLIAGKKEQIIGDIIIKETVPGSFVSGRTVTLTLPEQARWEANFEDKNSKDIQGAYSTTNGISISNIQYTDTDRRTLKLTISGNSSSNTTNPAEIDLRNMQVALQPGYTGDLTVQLGGTEGVTGNVTVASVQSPVSVKVDNAPNVVVGSGGQQIGTITLTENVAGGFGKTTVNGTTYNKVHLELPYGVQFDGTPTVQVTQGDLSIKDVSSGLGSDNKGYLDFYVDAESTTPSVVTISNAKLKLDRTVPQGDIVLKVKGNSVSYTASALDADGKTIAVQPWYDNNQTAASTIIAHVTTPAQSGSNVATFTVGSTSYTVNGVQQTMDVAPYLKNDGRVMLPVRFVANALGVTDDHIVWNGADQSVTIFKGNTVAKMTVGSTTMVVNGVAVQMDVAPELYNDGRVMLPIRWIGQALGAQLSWDQNTQTVTVTSQQ